VLSNELWQFPEPNTSILLHVCFYIFGIMSTLMPPTPSSDASSPSHGQPFGSPLSLVESPSQEKDLAAHSLKNLESINIRGQLQWEKHMKDIDPKRRYRKVSVLMIHWEKEGTDSFDAQQEVCLD
jgi:hypothetical protein